MKGIILAGGSGSRLYPITQAISKHLIPIYDKPMIYYPLSVLMLAGIRELLIISTPEHINLYKIMLGDGSKVGLKFFYNIQTKPRGLPDAFIVGEEFIAGEKVALILGDNLFFGQGFTPVLNEASSLKEGAIIFGYYVNNPEEFGVVEFDKNGQVISLEEKPKHPKSNYAISGLYFFDEEVVDIVKNLKPSPRGEIEITDLLNVYLKKEKLRVQLLGRGFAWLDTGTYDGLLEASNFVGTIQKRQGLYIACIEEIAYNMGYISRRDIIKIAENINNTEYGQYLKKISKKDEGLK
ncbi:MAG: glucose-1-phosphate thymidylyltransferase RfbA [Candidatus Lokiarchaeia archaeon]